MRLVTSLSPKRIDRQQKCVASWLRIGCEVTAVQSAGEATQLQDSFPNVEFVETDLVGDLFNRPKLVRIEAMLQLAISEPIMILNSDLEIWSTEDSLIRLKDFWETAEDKELKVGIRYDRNPRTKSTAMFKWGIDVFLITPQIAAELPDIGMTLGQPGWDYWIPWHLVKECGYKVNTNKEVQFLHDIHQRGWSSHEYHTGLKLFEKHYSVSGKELTQFVQDVTGRDDIARPGARANQKQRIAGNRVHRHLKAKK